jgi:hypothetical protein
MAQEEPMNPAQQQLKDGYRTQDFAINPREQVEPTEERKAHTANRMGLVLPGERASWWSAAKVLGSALLGSLFYAPFIEIQIGDYLSGPTEYRLWGAGLGAVMVCLFAMMFLHYYKDKHAHKGYQLQRWWWIAGIAALAITDILLVGFGLSSLHGGLLDPMQRWIPYGVGLLMTIASLWGAATWAKDWAHSLVIYQAAMVGQDQEPHLSETELGRATIRSLRYQVQLEAQKEGESRQLPTLDALAQSKQAQDHSAN